MRSCMLNQYMDVVVVIDMDMSNPFGIEDCRVTHPVVITYGFILIPFGDSRLIPHGLP